MGDFGVVYRKRYIAKIFSLFPVSAHKRAGKVSQGSRLSWASGWTWRACGPPG